MHRSDSDLDQRLKEIKTSRELQPILAEFPDQKEKIFEFVIQPEIFQRFVSKIIPTLGDKEKNDLYFLITSFPEYSDKLFELVCAPANRTRLVPDQKRLGHLRLVFPEYRAMLYQSSMERLYEIMSLYLERNANTRLAMIGGPQFEAAQVARLIQYLQNPGEDINEVTIAIGSACAEDGVNKDESWQQNVVFDSSHHQLILNLDPSLNSAVLHQGALDTETKKYLCMSFDEYVADTISPLIADLLERKIVVVLCDFRGLPQSKDIYKLVGKHLEHYRGPSDTEGHLVFLKGYFEFYPLLWPAKPYFDTENKKPSYLPTDYLDAMNALKKNAGKGDSASIFAYFEDKPILLITHFLPESHDSGIFFSYPRIGEVSKAIPRPDTDHRFRLF